LDTSPNTVLTLGPCQLTKWLLGSAHVTPPKLVRAAVETEGLRFIVANGISANRYRRADLLDTMQQLSYEPVDDAWSS
jgi:hypothetical protein